MRRSIQTPSVALWPPEQPPGSQGSYFYRPGELIIRSTSYERVHNALYGIDAKLELKQSGKSLMEQAVVGGVVDSEQPIPLLLKQLYQPMYRLSPKDVGPNHVFWPQWQLGGWPWYSGGAEWLPVQVPEPLPTMFDASNGRGAGVKIAVFDSGLLPDFGDNSPARGWLTDVTGDVEGVPPDFDDSTFLDLFDSHATFIAGVIKRIAPEANVVVRNVLEESGDVADDVLSTKIRALLNSMPDVRLVNLSLGGTVSDPTSVSGLASVIAEFPDVLFVAAAGNNGASGGMMFPAGLGNVVGVGALTADGSVPTFFSNQNSADVWAVGQDVISAFGRGNLIVPGIMGSQSYTTGMASWSGTSFAAPLVTAVLCDFVQGSTTTPLAASDAIDWLVEQYPEGHVVP